MDTLKPSVGNLHGSLLSPQIILSIVLTHDGDTEETLRRWVTEVHWKSQAFEGVEVSPLSNKLTPVKENEIPLLIGMKFKSVEFEKILSRRKKLKYA